MIKLIPILLLISLSGCEYIESKEYTIKTEGGELITFMCPKIDPARSKLTYFISGQCVLVK